MTTRGNRDEAIFLDGDDRAFLLAFLNRVVSRESWLCLAYCLMTNHYHVVIRVPDATLPRGMQWLNGLYAQTFNNRHGRKGHLFGSRYRLTFIKNEDHLAECCRYVVCNPVRAGLCRHPRDWPWSSYRATTGEETAPPFLAIQIVRSLFADGADGYAKYVAEVLEQEKGPGGVELALKHRRDGAEGDARRIVAGTRPTPVRLV